MRSKIPIVIGVIALLVLGTLGYFQYLAPASRMPDWVSIEEGPVAHGVDKFYRSVYIKGNLTTAGDLTVVGTANIGGGCTLAQAITFTNVTVTNTALLGDAITDNTHIRGGLRTWQSGSDFWPDVADVGALEQPDGAQFTYNVTGWGTGSTFGALTAGTLVTTSMVTTQTAIGSASGTWIEATGAGNATAIGTIGGVTADQGGKIPLAYAIAGRLTTGASGDFITSGANFYADLANAGTITTSKVLETAGDTWTYGLDFNAATMSIDIRLSNGETIDNADDGVVNITTDDLVVGGGHDFTGSPSTIAGGDTNTMYSKFSFLGGGFSNVITGTDITDDARYSVLVGGNANQINSTGDELALVGGYDNLINGVVDYSILGGGYSNEISGTLSSSVLVGGAENNVGGSWASILGGYENDASGDYSLALGRRAKATNDGTFVWGDSTDADVTDIGANSFNVRASGGMYVKGPAYLETGYAAKTASYTALITETGKTFSNQGATAEITITLPGAAVGYNYCVYVFAAYTVTVQPASADQIHHLTDAATNRIQNAGTVGDNVCLAAADNTYWLPVPAEHGTWTDIN